MNSQVPAHSLHKLPSSVLITYILRMVWVHSCCRLTSIY